MNKLSKWLLLASFFGTCGEQMITPIYGMFVDKIGGSIIDAGVGYAIFSIITGIIVIISSYIQWFKCNLELICLLGFFIASIGDFSYFFVHSSIGLFLVQATNGISVGLLNPAWETLYTKNTSDGNEHSAWSIWGGGANISTGISAIVGSVITTYFGFKSMFVTTAFINMIAVLYAYKIYKNERFKKI